MGSAKVRQVLGILLPQANRAVDREQIIEGAWDGSPPRSAVNLVQKYVGDVRRSLGLTEGSLLTMGTGCLLRVAPVQLDSSQFALGLARAWEMEREGDRAAAQQVLADAMALWRGSAFSGVNTPAVNTERARLEEYRVGALEDLAELDLLRGEHALAIPELSRLAAEHPYRERVRELLVVALYRSGSQAEVFAVFHDIQLLLVEELGANPGNGLRRVHALLGGPRAVGVAGRAEPVQHIDHSGRDCARHQHQYDTECHREARTVPFRRAQADTANSHCRFPPYQKPQRPRCRNLPRGSSTRSWHTDPAKASVPLERPNQSTGYGTGSSRRRRGRPDATPYGVHPAETLAVRRVTWLQCPGAVHVPDNGGDHMQRAGASVRGKTIPRPSPRRSSAPRPE